MTINSAFEKLLPEHRQKLMAAFNEIEPMVIFLEDGYFLAVHTRPDYKFQQVEESTYWLLGRLIQ